MVNSYQLNAFVTRMLIDVEFQERVLSNSIGETLDEYSIFHNAKERISKFSVDNINEFIAKIHLVISDQYPNSQTKHQPKFKNIPDLIENNPQGSEISLN